MSSSKMRLGRSNKAAAAPEPAIQRDRNVTTYNAAEDARTEHESIRRIPLSRIEESRFQVRRVFRESAIADLADSIESTGLIHPPKVRPHPEKPGHYELLPGEMRLRALRQLAEMGRAPDVIGRDAATGEPLVPVQIEDVEDRKARMMVLTENIGRTDLSPWEEVLAIKELREWLKEEGEKHGVRDVAARVPNRAMQTVGEYLRAADGVTAEVIAAAGVMNDESEIAHSRLSALPLLALVRVARAADNGVEAGASALAAELARVEKTGAGTTRPAKTAKKDGSPLNRSFVINTRVPLRDLQPVQAAKYLERVAPFVAVLVERAEEELSADKATSLAEAFEAYARRLREQG